MSTVIGVLGWAGAGAAGGFSAGIVGQAIDTARGQGEFCSARGAIRIVTNTAFGALGGNLGGRLGEELIETGVNSVIKVTSTKLQIKFEIEMSEAIVTGTIGITSTGVDKIATGLSNLGQNPPNVHERILESLEMEGDVDVIPK